MSTVTAGARHVLIIGAARQGLALARFFASRGAEITLNDARGREQLAEAEAAVSGLPVRWVTGGHPVEILDGIDLVCVSGGVPLELPVLVEARRRGIRLTNDSQIFLEAAPCPVIGISGSAGKTTTTTLVGRMAGAAVVPPHKAWVGGNIGQPLIDSLDQMQPDDIAVMELSSFQLELMTRSPQIAALTNVTPNHLDRHGTFEAYTAAKARLLQFQSAGDTAVLNREDPVSVELKDQVRGRMVSFGHTRPETGTAGTYLDAGQVLWTDGSSRISLLDEAGIELRGDHNRVNVLAASAIAMAAGFEPSAVGAGVIGFRGVPHRLEFVRRLGGVSWYNDSIATAPERTKAAVLAFAEPLVLLLGGRDKKLPWQPLVDLIAQRVDHVIAFGEAGPMIAQQLRSGLTAGRTVTVDVCANLQEAVQTAARRSRPGDVVLLSPGCTSFDEFIDFEQRGERFRQWVNQLS